MVLNGHSEYWSLAMLKSWEPSCERGDTLVLFREFAFLEGQLQFTFGTVMECRKVDAPGNQMVPLERGKVGTVRMVSGGLPRLWASGLALCGLETLGLEQPGNPKNFGPYAAVTDHFSFIVGGSRVAAGRNSSGRSAGGTLHRGGQPRFGLRLSTLAGLQGFRYPGRGPAAGSPQHHHPGKRIIPWKEGDQRSIIFRPDPSRTDQGGG